jgi:hypothetical protein
MWQVRVAGGEWKNLTGAAFHLPLPTGTRHSTPQFGCGWAALGCKTLKPFPLAPLTWTTSAGNIEIEAGTSGPGNRA